jgi:hypothetical protein
LTGGTLTPPVYDRVFKLIMEIGLVGRSSVVNSSGLKIVVKTAGTKKTIDLV